jgi:hypothetical protein
MTAQTNPFAPGPEWAAAAKKLQEKYPRSWNLDQNQHVRAYLVAVANGTQPHNWTAWVTPELAAKVRKSLCELALGGTV